MVQLNPIKMLKALDSPFASWKPYFTLEINKSQIKPHKYLQVFYRIRILKVSKNSLEKRQVSVRQCSANVCLDKMALYKKLILNFYEIIP